MTICGAWHSLTTAKAEGCPVWLCRAEGPPVQPDLRSDRSQNIRAAVSGAAPLHVIVRTHGPTHKSP